MSSPTDKADKAMKAHYGDKMMVDKSRLARIKLAMHRIDSDHMYFDESERQQDEEYYQEGVARGLFHSPMMR